MNDKLYTPQILSAINGSWREDWRIMGQEGYLKGKHLEHRQFDRNLCVCDFDQCEFCYACFDKDKRNPLFAYFEPEERLWICENCYKDFCGYFQWTVEESDDKG